MPTAGRGRNLGDVHRCRDRADADGHAQQQTCNVEGTHAGCDGRCDRPDNEDRARCDEAAAATDAVDNRHRYERTHHRTQQHRRHDGALADVAQVECIADVVECAGDNTGVKPEEQPGERCHHRDARDQALGAAVPHVIVGFLAAAVAHAGETTPEQRARAVLCPSGGGAQIRIPGIGASGGGHVDKHIGSWRSWRVPGKHGDLVAQGAALSCIAGGAGSHHVAPR